MYIYNVNLRLAQDNEEYSMEDYFIISIDEDGDHLWIDTMS